ncbi:60S ribosomal protein L28 [Mucor velutinosus]|uniref:60S ribosomal protein L28 n=1 Tax=Mucor velutinosus TaxID=708070 RepID=A0AAN7D6D9_9FUNG|nr:60S ribosomal protein L28 [Mucor velutinosus]
MSLFLAKKQEDNNQKKVRDLLRLKENKKCFDCPTKSPAFVNTTIQTFICARCSGLVREVGHRVKAVSASKFSGAELMALKKGGNGIALKIWLSNYSTHDAPEPEVDADVRAFMKQKYYECKWLDRALLQSHKEEVRVLIAKSFTEDGLPIVTKSRTRIIPGFSRVPLIADSEMNVMQDDEEGMDTSVIQNDSVIPPPIVMPGYAVPAPLPQVQPQYQHQAAVAAYPISSASPVCRTSMDSINSYLSSSQGGSIYNYRSSQDMARTDMCAVNNNMQSLNNAQQQQVASASTVALTAEQIAERCRSSIDSNASCSLSSNVRSNRQSMEAAQQQPANAVASMALTAEQIAERCRNTIDYKTCAESYQQQDAYTPPTMASEAVAPVVPTEKSLPQLSIDVSNNDLVYHRHRSDYQVKSPTLVNYSNNNQPPFIQRDGHHVPASASLRVTPSTSNPITKPTRPPMAAPAASASVFDSILSDLAGLKLEKTVRRATYTGGILTPVTPAAVGNSPLETSKSSPHPTDRPASMFSADFFSQLNTSKATENDSPENDPYAALRGIPAPAVATPTKTDATKDDERNTSSSEDDDDEEDPWQEFCSSSSTDGNEDSFLGPQQVIQPTLEESKPVSNMIAIDLFSDLDPRSMFKRF